jgi:ADP-heptose:LPS heptosyltransferase
MATLSVFDVTNDNKGLDYFIPENDRYDIKGLNNVDKNYIAFVLGATYFTKQIPNALVIKIIDSIGKMVVLLGGPDDIEKANEVEKASNSKVINLCGKINLNQSASVIEQSAIVITSDTGLMHIAAAFNKPIISLWGNTVPEFGMSPYLPKPKSAIFENKDLKCRPCSKIGFNECPKKHFDCMNTLDPEQISQYIKSLDVL